MKSKRRVKIDTLLTYAIVFALQTLAILGMIMLSNWAINHGSSTGLEMGVGAIIGVVFLLYSVYKVFLDLKKELNLIASYSND